jgi:hypothetical protein
MYYAWNWWWFVSSIIPLILIAWIVVGYSSGRYRGYRGHNVRDGVEWEDWSRVESELRQPEKRGRGPRNYRRSDARIFEDVCDRLSVDDRVDASDIEVQIVDSRVLLRGTVASRAEKRVAEVIAELTAGVADVDNYLRVGGPTSSAQTGAPQPPVPAHHV